MKTERHIEVGLKEMEHGRVRVVDLSSTFETGNLGSEEVALIASAPSDDEARLDMRAAVLGRHTRLIFSSICWEADRLYLSSTPPLSHSQLLLSNTHRDRVTPGKTRTDDRAW